MSASIAEHTSRLIDALKNPKEMTREALIAAVEDAKCALMEWQEEWAGLEKEAKKKEEEKKAAMRVKMAKKTRPALEFVNGPEGVVAAVTAARSPGTVGAETSPPSVLSAPPAPALVKQPARRLAIPKELVIDMVDDLAVTDAGGRGQRTRKPREIFKEDIPPPKRPARTASRAPSAPPPPPPAKNKRKRVPDDRDEDELSASAATVPPPTKKRATSRAASTAPSVSTAPVPPKKGGRTRKDAVAPVPAPAQPKAGSNIKAKPKVDKAKKKLAAPAAAKKGKGRSKEG